MNSKPTEESFPELPDFLVFLRFVFAVAYGVFIGMKGVRSGVMVLQGLNVIAFVPVMYCRFFLFVEQGQFDTQIIFSGTFNALALFLLIWIYFFTAEHVEDEARLAALLISASIPDGEATPDLTVSDSGNVVQDVPPLEEPEF